MNQFEANVFYNFHRGGWSMKTVWLMVLVGVLMMMPMAAQAQYWTGNVNLFLGAKAMDEDDWEPVDQHTEFGFLLDFGQTTWPVNIAIDVLGSVATETEYSADLEVTTTEIDLGIRKAWGQAFRPYLGGGVAFISVKSEISGFGYSYSDDDSGTGFWLNGGLMLTLGDAFNLGLDLRYSSADVFDNDVDGGGTHAGIVLGYHW
jgi:opacity protein-like surface antigen